MKAISNAIKGVSYHNPQLGESLYELCRRATSRHIDRPDEILNQQIVYMINSEMHTPYAAKDACTCLKRRLQMDHPQKQYLAIILTSKVLQECHSAIGIYQGELLQDIAYILRTVRSSSPAAARTRQVAMDVLRHFGAAGGDAYRQARQVGALGSGPSMLRPDGTPAGPRDPAAVAAERASLLDEIKRMVEQASASTEILNELILNKQQAGATTSDDSANLRKELLADVRELRKLFDLYMEQLATLTGADAEAAMKEALEAVDQLDNALTLEKDVDAELKDLEQKGQLPSQGGSADNVAAAPAAAAAVASTASLEVAGKMQSMNLIDLDDDATPAATSGLGAAVSDPFAPPAAAGALRPAAAADPFAPAAAAGAFTPLAGSGGGAPADPFAALAAATAGFPAPTPYPAMFPAAAGPAAFADTAGPAPGAAPAEPATAADPFADPTPAWGPPSTTSVPSAATTSFDSSVAAAATASPIADAAAAAASTTPAAAAAASSGVPPSVSPLQPQQPLQPFQQPQQLPSTGSSGGGFMPAFGTPQFPPYGATAGANAAAPYAVPAAGPTGYGMPAAAASGYGIVQPSPYGMYPAPLTTGGGGPTPAGAQPGMLMQPQQPYTQPVAYQQQPYMQPFPQQQQQLPLGYGASPVTPQVAPPTGFLAAADGQGPPGGGSTALSASNPFASVAPVSSGGGSSPANPFGQTPATASAGGSVEAEWNTFFKK